jgi:WD40 repeat protein
VGTGECAGVIKSHTDPLKLLINLLSKIYLLILMKNKYVVSGSCDNTIRVWDVSTGECAGVMKGHTDWVVVASFSPFSRRLGMKQLLTLNCISSLF